MKLILSGEDVAIQMGNRRLYSGVSFALHQGEMLALTGENGVGKTTLVRAIMGQVHPVQGRIQWAQARPVMSYVPQYRAEADAFGLRIIDFVGLSFDQGFRPWLSRVEKSVLATVLAQTGLTDIATRRMDTASGGERQRAYLAQALVRQPQLLILDEATANLDVDAKFELMDAVATQQHQANLGVLLISHDPEIVARYADATLHLQAGGGTLMHHEGVVAHV